MRLLFFCRTTRIQPPGGMSHINSEMVAVDNKEVVKQVRRHFPKRS